VKQIINGNGRSSLNQWGVDTSQAIILITYTNSSVVEYEGSTLLTNKPNQTQFSATPTHLPSSQFFHEVSPYKYYTYICLVCPT
jgi:hypothetical protein